MMTKLSRRSLLKMAAALASTGVLAWVPDRLKGEGNVMDALEAVPVPVIALADDQPWGVYCLDPDNRPATLITWGADGEEIITKYD